MSIPEILQSPVMSQLAVLDIKKGTLTDAGIEPLIDASATANLKILNVTGNLLSSTAVNRLTQQPYRVISDYQEAGYPCAYDKENDVIYGAEDWMDGDYGDLERVMLTDRSRELYYYETSFE